MRVDLSRTRSQVYGSKRATVRKASSKPSLINIIKLRIPKSNFHIKLKGTVNLKRNLEI
jgi:hypothetical protein